jgi:hypothetical protein
VPKLNLHSLKQETLDKKKPNDHERHKQDEQGSDGILIMRTEHESDHF